MDEAMTDLLLRGRRIITAEGERAGAVRVSRGRIVSVDSFDVPAGTGPDGSAPAEVVLADDCVLLPGLVDSHVHINEPGRTEWEGFASATAAAAAGGITTVVDMPLNSIPPTVDLAALRVKQRAAEHQVHVDVAFWGGAVPANCVLNGTNDLRGAAVDVDVARPGDVTLQYEVSDATNDPARYVWGNVRPIARPA